MVDAVGKINLLPALMTQRVSYDNSIAGTKASFAKAVAVLTVRQGELAVVESKIKETEAVKEELKSLDQSKSALTLKKHDIENADPITDPLALAIYEEMAASETGVQDVNSKVAVLEAQRQSCGDIEPLKANLLKLEIIKGVFSAQKT